MATSPGNPEDGWELYRRASEAYKAKDFKLALELCRQSWRAFGDDAKPDQLRNRYGYCIYQLELKPLTQEDEPEFEEVHAPNGADRCGQALKATEAICRMTSQGQYSPYAISVLALSKILKRNRGHWAEIEEWTAKLDPERLSTEPVIFTDRDGKERELASEREKWYGARVRALLETQKYVECVELAESYAKTFQKCHHDYDVWIPYWQSEALIARRRTVDALKLADTLVARKPNVHTITLRSKAQEATDDVEQAWITALEAVHEHVEPKHMLSAVNHLVHLMELRGQKDDLWQKGIELLVRIRSTEDWRIPGPLQILAAEAGIAKTNLNRVDELNNLLQQLRKCWWREWVKAEPRLTGAVENLRENSCFLKTSTGKSVYASSRALPRRARQGSNVSFWIRASFDRSKNRMSERAIHIRLED